jgi:predicted amidophosphoribosyltransferase
MQDIKNFDYRDFDIDFDICRIFFEEYHTIVHKKLKKDFKIFKIPTSDEDVNQIFNQYQKLFKKKSEKFQNKLLKIIYEVIDDIKKLEVF